MHTTTPGTDVPNLRDELLENLVWYEPEELEYHAPCALQHTHEHIDCFQRTIDDFQGAQPVVANCEGFLLAGQGRVEAARLLGIDEIPTLLIERMTEEDRKQYVKALTKFGNYVGWNRAILHIDLQHLKKIRLSPAAKFDNPFYQSKSKKEIIRQQPD